MFNGDNYQLWAARMTSYLEAMDLWEVVEEDYVVPQLPENPTMAQIKVHKEKTSRKSKAKATLFAAVSTTIFIRIMCLKTGKEVWDYLKEEYEGDEKIRGMQALNLIREFEMQRMKESETIKEYSDRLLDIRNKTQEQRRLMRHEHVVEGALPAKHRDERKQKKKSDKNSSSTSVVEDFVNNQNQTKVQTPKKNYPPCKHCGKMGHPPFRCWKRPDAKCNKCNQVGHEAVIYRSNTQKHEEVHKATQDEEDHMFVASCYSTTISPECWLIDSGCINHMCNDISLFKEVFPLKSRRVKVGNGEYVIVKGIGTVAIITTSGPQRTPSLQGNVYHIIFIDDFTRMCWTYFMKFKSEVTDVFWKFKKMVENQSDWKIQVLRSDNGKEYTSEKFNMFCKEADIEHQLTVPYSP
ncbi:uncharacterized protein LOC111881897 [Lactuca sativa]|uniref:uncharacterized protein LOC111881897 n=1 Tax=Lactuca sativa TaxID=4236 RepID=UPI000CD843BE|nr:uncharacterized protein LOC111881897 [Lactuca sativa]